MNSVIVNPGIVYSNGKKETDYTFDNKGLTLPDRPKYGKDKYLEEKTSEVLADFAKRVNTPKKTTTNKASKSDNRTVTSEYVKTYTSYSGHDMVCTFELPLPDGSSINKVIGSVQTISYSIHNEKMPVRVLGDMNMKCTVFNSRTVAGSLIFTVFDHHWCSEMIQEYLSAIGSNSHALMDELPPFNITISMANEYGQEARLAIYGVTFVNEGQVMSVQDVYTENTYQFLARDIDYLTNDINGNGAGEDSLLSKTVQGKIDELNSDVPIDYTGIQKPSVTKASLNVNPYNLTKSYITSMDYTKYCQETIKTFNKIQDDIKALYEYGSIDEKEREEYYNQAEEAYKRARYMGYLYSPQEEEKHD